jgi:flagellar hook-associated protein 1 FlgK
MSRIWSMMDVGKRSMMGSQTALQTVSHNVANKNTEGYSRQRVDMVTNEPIGHGKLRMGMGARPVGVSRINNPYLEKQLENEGNELGTKDARAQMLMRVEQVYNEQSNKGLNKFIGEFFNSYREMSNSPENLALRNLAKESADFMAKDFNRVHGQLTKIQGEADFQIAVEVSDINALTREIAQLNENIQMVEINALEANDERDRRDLLLKKLGEKIDIKYGENKEGAVTVTAANSAVLVSGSQQRDLTVGASAARQGKRDGAVDIYYKASDAGTSQAITGQIRGGKLGGLLQVRDQFINDSLSKINELATVVSREVNRVHMEGFDRYSRKGQALFVTKSGMDSAESLAVNSAIANDPGLVVAAGQPNSPGDNRIANVMSALQYKMSMAGGRSTFDDYYNTIVGDVGVAANKANNELTSQKDIVSQLTNIRESISGVSLDEETAKMIEFQKTFEASARLIRTADEMMDTVLSLKRT